MKVTPAAAVAVVETLQKCEKRGVENIRSLHMYVPLAISYKHTALFVNKGVYTL